MVGSKSKLLTLMQQHLGKKDYQYVAIYRRTDWKDRFLFNRPKYLYNLSPLEWYHVYSAFFLNITTFFHGTLIALRNGVPTFSLDNTSLGVDYTSKLKQVYTNMNLSDYLFDNTHVTPSVEKRFLELLDYTIIHRDEVSQMIDLSFEKEKEKAESFFQYLDTII